MELWGCGLMRSRGVVGQRMYIVEDEDLTQLTMVDILEVMFF